MAVKHLAAIALGSNLHSAWGDRRASLNEATRQIGALGRVRAVSEFQDTAPVGYLDQPRFLNGVLLLETELEARELLRKLLLIERAMGRDRAATVEKGPRVIDLDILLFDDLVLEEPELIIPHPAMRDRLFVLEPLAEIAGDMVDPITRLTVRELLVRLLSTAAVQL